MECLICYGYFFVDEIVVYVDLCVENVYRFLFLGLMEILLLDYILDEYVVSLNEICINIVSNVLFFFDFFSFLVDKFESQLRINVRRGQLFFDYVEVRKRCQWIKVENRFKVIFVGELVEDSGGFRREFFVGQFFYSFYNFSNLIYINIECLL